MAKVLLPLDVDNSREGYRRLSTFISIMSLLMLTALWCLLYECAFLTVVDRDARDMTFDYRVTHEGISRYHGMLATAYWPTNAENVNNWDADVLRPSQDIPVVVTFIGPPSNCQGPGGVNLCRQMRNAVAASVAQNPGLIRTAVAWDESLQVPQLQVYNDRRQMPEGLIPAGSVNQQDVDFLISLVIENYVDPYYIPPRKEGAAVPLWNSVQVGSPSSDSVVGMGLQVSSRRNLRRIGWPRELVYWGFGQCEDTSMKVNSFQGSINIKRPPIRSAGGAPVVPRLQLYFLESMQTYVDWYSVDVRPDGRVSVAPLSSVQVRVLMVPQEGDCCAWQLVDAIGVYSRSRLVGPLEAIPSFYVGEQVTVGVELRDVAEAQPPYFPRLKGPALVYCGIIMGGIAFIMLGLTPILMFVVQYNVMVNNGLPPPWFLYSTKYRGW